MPTEHCAYDKFGETQPGTGLTEANDSTTTWLFAGNGQYDQQIQLTYHLARWRQGHRFVSLDLFAGIITDPQSLHKYLYTHSDPVNGGDPTGLAQLVESLNPS